jgi:hypothetical protein
MPIHPGKLSIRRVLTKTPLARQHERAKPGGRARAARAVPWATFDRSKYPASALALAENAMLALAGGEYGAVDAFSRLVSALARNGAPFDLVSAAAEVPIDEVRHAELALRTASLYAGKDVAVDLDTSSFDTPWPSTGSLEDLDAAMVQLPTISETLAAALIDACRERATDPMARAVFSTIMADEVHHLRLGWYYLAWREPQWTRAERQRAADVAGHMIVQIERQFWNGRDAPRGSQRAAAALGVLDSKTQRAAIKRVVEDELLPGLDALGLGASRAWRVRVRGKA